MIPPTLVARAGRALLLLICLSPLLRAVPEPLRLDVVAAVRFTESAPQQWTITYGLLTSRGQFQVTSSEPVLSTVTIPPAALNRTLLTLEAWSAYRRLGPEATGNFAADPEATHYRIHEREYIDVAPHASPNLAHGRVVNLSSRGLVAPGVPMIGGFVIEDQHRWVLVRALGPGLKAMGVQAALANPSIAIFRGSTFLNFNNDWNSDPDAAAIAAAGAAVGAFPLQPGSRDAAVLVELPPGTYTAHATTEADETGEVLLEIYTIPE